MRRVGIALLVCGGVAAAVEKSDSPGRPADAITLDKRATDDDAQDRARRRDNLREQSEAHRALLRGRLRALYKMSNGGSVRLLLSANNVDELSSRSLFVRRLLERDMQELKALNEETADLQGEVSGAKPNYQVIGNGLSAADFQRGHLQRPVPGKVASSFGPFRDEELQVDRSRRGVEMHAAPKEIVHAAAAGKVVWIGDIPGIGRGIAIDHGGGFISLTGRLTNLAVGLNEPVRRGDAVGEALEKLLYFEVSQGATAVDPVPWMEKPGRPRK
jgi:septal ring factor EnvC (AmiA/AmiB activator)